MDAGSYLQLARTAFVEAVQRFQVLPEHERRQILIGLTGRFLASPDRMIRRACANALLDLEDAGIALPISREELEPWAALSLE